MNCKPGDLALMICESTSRNRGRTPLVEVLSAYTGKEYAGKKTTKGIWAKPCWLVRSLGRPIGHTGDGGASHIVPCPDAWLRPIRPGDISDEEVRNLYLPKLPEAA